MKPLPVLLSLLLIAASGVFSRAEASVHLQTPSGAGSLSIQNWKSMRDARIVKQSLDYSCGAASLATLLNEFYGESLSEADILLALDKSDLRASFADMQRALPQLGYRAVAYAASYEQLTSLQVPVVVYLQHRGNEHFSVLRGIDAQTVWLADPSLGNRTYSREQFLAMWNTRGNDAGHAYLSGRLLAVLPLADGSEADAAFFSNEPLRQSAAALRHLSISR